MENPKLRAIDARPVVQAGKPAILLRDPLGLSDKTVVIPQQLGPLLALCDGTRDANALYAALAVRFGLRISPSTIGQLLATLDEALLLDNEGFARAWERALTEYHAAPFRPFDPVRHGYPATADGLRDLMDGYVRSAGAAAPGSADIRGLVSPHVDYARGGPVYAAVWQRAAEAAKSAELVVVLGTDHFGKDGRLTLTRQDYATPFGVLPTDGAAVQALAERMGEEEAFAGELYHRAEHSIELAAAWLHYVREGQPCALLPVLCGSFAHFVRGEARPEKDPVMTGFVDLLRSVLIERKAVVVAAADLSHVGPAFGGQPLGLVERARLQAADEELVGRICVGDAEGFLAAIQREGNRYNVCGVAPIYLALCLLSPVRGEQVAYERCRADDQGTSLVSVAGIVFR